MGWSRNGGSQAVAETALLGGGTSRERSKVLALGTMLCIKAGSTLTEQETAGKEVFVIVSGTARCLRDGKQIATLRAGDLVGEIAVLDGGVRTATVIAESPMRVLVFSHREFLALVDSVPTVARQLLPILASRARSTMLASPDSEQAGEQR
jgi:CRP-like cAMP-binding protein